MKVLITLSILVAYASAVTLTHLKAEDNVLCEKPVCHINETTLWPHIDPFKYWRCVPGINEDDPWIAAEIECIFPWMFSWAKQGCEWCDDWDNVCGVPSPTHKKTKPSPGKPGDCSKPECDPGTSTKWPHIDPTKYWQCQGFSGFCEQEIWEAVEQRCPAPLYFNSVLKLCVWLEDWDNVCGVFSP